MMNLNDSNGKDENMLDKIPGVSHKLVVLGIGIPLLILLIIIIAAIIIYEPLFELN